MLDSICAYPASTFCASAVMKPFQTIRSDENSVSPRPVTTIVSCAWYLYVYALASNQALTTIATPMMRYFQYAFITVIF